MILLLRTLAAALLLASAAIHLYLLPEHLSPEMVAMGHGYIGWLFFTASVALVVLAALLVWVPDPAVWNAAAALCLAMVVALVWSRVGSLPRGYHEPWEPLAVWSLVVELGFLGCWVRALSIRRQLVAPAGRRAGR